MSAFRYRLLCCNNAAKVRPNENRTRPRVAQAGQIRGLNPLIRGWANYHRNISAKRTYDNVDHIIWQTLWRWARRRHPQKSAHWVAEKYWHPGEGHGWTFAANTGSYTEKGKPIRIHLLKATKTAIRRHPKIKSDANPFDQGWRDYFEQRVLLKRIAPELVEQHAFLISNNEQPPVVKTGPAPAEL